MLGVVGVLLGNNANRFELPPVVSVCSELLEAFDRPSSQITLWCRLI
ncbi:MULTISPECIES: hypothetical protein [Streptomyces]